MRLRRLITVWTATLILAMGATALLAAGPATKDVMVAQARQLIQDRGGKADFVVLDVRTPEEFANGRLPGAVNVNIQVPDFQRRLAALDRGKTYLVYCRTGNRSARAIQVMQRLGFQSLYHMTEGILRWEKKGFPLSRPS
jgi:rhodanese-related sulfurtransferase